MTWKISFQQKPSVSGTYQTVKHQSVQLCWVCIDLPLSSPQFCVFNGPGTTHSLFWSFGAEKISTTHWSGGRVQVWAQVRAPAGHLAITPEGYSRRQSKVLRFWLQNHWQWPSSWGRAPAQLGRVGQASTNTGHFRVCGSRCGAWPGRLRKTCHHSCDIYWAQESKRF